MVDNEERQEDNRRTNPVQGTSILTLDDNLTNQRQRNSQTKANSNNQGSRKKHSVRPRNIRDERSERVNLQASYQ